MFLERTNASSKWGPRSFNIAQDGTRRQSSAYRLQRKSWVYMQQWSVTIRTVDSKCTHARPINEHQPARKADHHNQKNITMMTSKGGMISSKFFFASSDFNAWHQISNLFRKKNKPKHPSKPTCRNKKGEAYRSTANATNQLHRFSASTGTYGAEPDPSSTTSFFSSANIRRSARCPLISGMRTNELSVFEKPIWNRVGIV